MPAGNQFDGLPPVTSQAAQNLLTTLAQQVTAPTPPPVVQPAMTPAQTVAQVLASLPPNPFLLPSGTQPAANQQSTPAPAVVPASASGPERVVVPPAAPSDAAAAGPMNVTPTPMAASGVPRPVAWLPIGLGCGVLLLAAWAYRAHHVDAEPGR